ncbi:MFS transporter [Nocardia sp. NPDC088792]|uniref:MFS transporter n=1 Tax=Nocardia sp. NPDC088792 TaxID=3364332 RepID=UPI003821E9C3
MTTTTTAAAPLAGRDFRSWWAAVTVSAFGTAVSSIAIPLVAVLSLHASTFQVGLLDAAGTVAWLAIGLHAGVWVEHMRRRAVLIVCDLLRAGLLLSIPIAAFGGVLSLAQLVVVALGMGLVTVVYGVARQAYVPFLVGRERLVVANGRIESTQSAAAAAGQLLGGVLVTTLGAAAAVLIDVVSYVLSVVLMTPIRVREPAPERPDPQSGTRQRLLAGLHHVFGDPVIRLFVLTAAIVNFADAALMALLVPYLVHELHAGAAVIGVVMAITQGGAVVGAAVTDRVVRAAGPVRALFGAVLSIPLFMVLVPLPFSGPVAITATTIGLTAVAAVATVAGIIIRSHRQATVPSGLLARVSAAIRFLTWGVIPLGALAGGGLGSVIGNRPALWLVCGAFLTCGLPLVIAAMTGGQEFRAGLHALSDQAH